MKTLDKSSERLAMEIQGKTRTEAENHLVKYGASVAGAAAAVTMCIGARSQTVSGDRGIVAYCIETNC